MSGRQRIEVDPAVASILAGPRPGPVEPARPARRQSKRTPHEAGRPERTVGVTFPSAEWRDAVQELAQRWGCRQGDVMVYAVAHLLAAVEAGKVQRPRGEVEWWQRAGEGLELPWEP